MASYFKAGSFAKTTEAATATQQVTGLGFTPRALILFSTLRTATGIGSADSGLSIGLSGAAANSYSASIFSADNSTPSNASRRYAAKALTIVGATESLLAECDLASFDAGGFTLSWTTNDSNAYLINYLAIGGDSVAAKAVQWTMPTLTGDKAVTGAGFTPDCVFHLNCGNGATGAVPTSQGAAAINFGCMTAGGQWGSYIRSVDNSATTSTVRTQYSDACITSIAATLAVQLKAAFVSFDSDGFTVNYSTAGNANIAFSLCLKLGNALAGTLTKSTGAATDYQAITGVGFRPAAVLLSGVNDTTLAPATHARLSVGASDGSNNQAIAFADDDSVLPSAVDSATYSTGCYAKVDNSTSTLDALAATRNTHPDGFGLAWTTNDAVGTKIGWVALGSAPDSGIVVERDIATPIGRELKIGWKADVNGSASLLLPSELNGRLAHLVTQPLSDASPTDNYDITLTDEWGCDVLMSCGLNRDSANAEFKPIHHSASPLLRSYVTGRHTISIANAGSYARGRFTLVIVPMSFPAAPPGVADILNRRVFG